MRLFFSVAFELEREKKNNRTEMRTNDATVRGESGKKNINIKQFEYRYFLTLLACLLAKSPRASSVWRQS